MGRVPCCEKDGLKKGRWTTEEDEILVNYIKAHGEGSWRSLPKKAGLLRCGKSCRLRWVNYLRTDLKRGNITEEEERTIIKLHTSLGNRWSLIAAHLPGRTDNEIKNHWNTHLSRRIHVFRRADPIIMDLGRIGGSRRRRRAAATGTVTPPPAAPAQAGDIAALPELESIIVDMSFAERDGPIPAHFEDSEWPIKRSSSCSSMADSGGPQEEEWGTLAAQLWDGPELAWPWQEDEELDFCSMSSFFL